MEADSALRSDELYAMSWAASGVRGELLSDLSCRSRFIMGE